MDALMVSTKSNTTEATTNIFNYTTMFGILRHWQHRKSCNTPVNIKVSMALYLKIAKR